MWSLYFKTGIFLCILPILITCSSMKGSKRSDSQRMYTAKLGTSSVPDMKEKTRDILMRYQYEIVRLEESSDQIYFETQWKYRMPDTSEILSGIVDARSKIIIIGRVRTRGAFASGGALLKITMQAETQMRNAEEDAWSYVNLSSFKEDYDRLADDLRIEYQMGIRTY